MSQFGYFGPGAILLLLLQHHRGNQHGLPGRGLPPSQHQAVGRRVGGGGGRDRGRVGGGGGRHRGQVGGRDRGRGGDGDGGGGHDWHGHGRGRLGLGRQLLW